MGGVKWLARCACLFGLGSAVVFAPSTAWADPSALTLSYSATTGLVTASWTRGTVETAVYFDVTSDAAGTGHHYVSGSASSTSWVPDPSVCGKTWRYTVVGLSASWTVSGANSQVLFTPVCPLPSPAPVAVTNFPAPVATVAVGNFPAPVATVSVGNFPVPVSTVAVGNFPLPVSSVGVTNFPAAQPVTWPSALPVREVAPVAASSTTVTCGGVASSSASPSPSAAPTPTPEPSSSPASTFGECQVKVADTQYLTVTLFLAVFLLLALAGFVKANGVTLTRGNS